VFYMIWAYIYIFICWKWVRDVCCLHIFICAWFEHNLLFLWSKPREFATSESLGHYYLSFCVYMCHSIWEAQGANVESLFVLDLIL